MAEKPLIISNEFEVAVDYKRDETGEILRGKNGKPQYKLEKFKIEAVYKSTEEILKTAVKYTTIKVQAKIRASRFPNEKGKVTPYDVTPNKTFRVDAEGNIGLSLEERRAKLLEELALIESQLEEETSELEEPQEPEEVTQETEKSKNRKHNK